LASEGTLFSFGYWNPERILQATIMKYFVYLAIERKEAILDPSGKATEHALGSLGFSEIENTRIGKLIRLTIDADSPEKARTIGESAGAKLLANPIMEDFSVIEVALEPRVHATRIPAKKNGKVTA
jgi:phosphoribosylformylglycinamidine synthase PurS subunit